MKVLGIHEGHDASASLVVDGKIICDVAEERLSRVKNDSGFPTLAIKECLKRGDITSSDLDILAFASNKVLSKHAISRFPALVDSEEGRKRVYNGKSLIEIQKIKWRRKNREAAHFDLLALPGQEVTFEVSDRVSLVKYGHHFCHAASAFYSSPYNDREVLVFVADGLGDEDSISVYKGAEGKLTLLESYGKEFSIGWAFSLVTEALGWRHGTDEWKVMGLAPYGTRNEYIERVLSEYFPRISEDGRLCRGSYGRQSVYIDHGALSFHLEKAIELRNRLVGYRREDIACTAQLLVEELLMWLVKSNVVRYGINAGIFAGGCFLNVKANGRIWQQRHIQSQWIFPNQGDAGLSLGAALAASNGLSVKEYPNGIEGFYLGCDFSNREVKEVLDITKVRYTESDNIAKDTARLLVEGKIVGWFQGRMESGPRALGGRSILMDPRASENKDIVNRCVKYRETFRPFCPSMTREYAQKVLEDYREEMFMSSSFMVKDEFKDDLSAVVHVDGSCRPQVVTTEANPRYHQLIREFGQITGGVEALLNTSFNVKGEPVVYKPIDAVRCFFGTGLDYLVIEDFIVMKYE